GRVCRQRRAADPGRSVAFACGWPPAAPDAATGPSPLLSSASPPVYRARQFPTPIPAVRRSTHACPCGTLSAGPPDPPPMRIIPPLPGFTVVEALLAMLIAALLLGTAIPAWSAASEAARAAEAR